MAKRARTTAAAAASAIGDARTIVYVHGIGNKPEPAILKCQWDRALFGFDLGERSRLAYWVSREYYPEPAAGNCESGDKVKLEEQPTGKSINLLRHLQTTAVEAEVEAVVEAQEDKPSGSAVSQREQRAVLLNLARRLEGRAFQPGGTGPAAREVRARILPLPAGLRKWLTRMFTRALLRDVNDLFFVEQRREVMRRSLRERLLAGGGPFVIVAHSQGSMIAYDVLIGLTEEERKRCDIRLLVTIGSPLGLKEVQDQLTVLTGQKRLAPPKGVPRWINVADPLDPVALDKGLRNDYNGGGIITDHTAWNADSPWDPHSGTGYLRLPVVQDAVRETVDTSLFQQVAPFTIARDVVREMENAPAGARHKVLIELSNGGDAPVPLDATAAAVLAEIKRVGGDESEVPAERLRRFVVAELTRQEAETLTTRLAVNAPGVRVPAIKRIWKNARKRALLTVSSQTVQATPAHGAYRATGAGIHWAVLDSGIHAGHPHFRRHANIGAQFDCTRRGPLSDGGTASDENGHGTHVAGIIAGAHSVPSKRSDGWAVSGIAPETTLHIYKVLDRQGNGEDAWIIKALDHIAETNERAGGLRIHGVNLSLGGPFDQSVYGCGHSPLCAELRRLWRQGVAVVLAAGNEGFAVLQTLDGTVDANMDLSIGDPANLEEAIAVGSVHKANPHTYGISYFSSRGPTADGRQKPDLVAPGERILSCRHAYPKRAPAREQLYVEMSGTSMAAPHVSGILAAFLSVRREFIGYPDRVKRILLQHCTDLARDRPQQGAGMPNLVKMLVNT